MHTMKKLSAMLFEIFGMKEILNCYFPFVIVFSNSSACNITVCSIITKVASVTINKINSKYLEAFSILKENHLKDLEGGKIYVVVKS